MNEEEVIEVVVDNVEVLPETELDKRFRENSEAEREKKSSYRSNLLPQNKLANAINECNSAISKCKTVIDNTKDALSLSRKRLRRMQKRGSDKTSKFAIVRASIKNKSDLLFETKETMKTLNKRLKYLLDLLQKIDDL